MKLFDEQSIRNHQPEFYEGPIGASFLLMNGPHGDNLVDHNLSFDQLRISDVPAKDKMEASYSNSHENGLYTPKKSSRKNVLVKISAVAEVESTFAVTTSPDYASPSFVNNSFEVNFQPEKGNNLLSKREFFDPDDCTWNPRLHATSGGGRRYHCRCCRKKFVRKRDLNRHQHIVHGVLAYVCKTRGCTERFETMTDLANHRSRVHLTNRTPRNCKLCNRKFVTEKSLMMHLRWHNLRPFRCKKRTLYLQTRKEWSEHRDSAYPVEKDQAKPKNSTKSAAPLSKKEEKEIQAVLSRLPAILPKPPRGNHLKIPIPPFHSGPSSDSRELRPLMPASFVNSFPEENYVPIYSSRPSPATDNVSEQMVHPPINAILPPQYPQANYENIYPIDSSYYVPPYQTNSGYGVQVETDFGMPPVEVVDLNTYPVEITSPTDINWPNPDSFAVDHNQNWLQPINLYEESQQDAELMQMVEETLQGDLNQNL
nr:zinc finger C2H2 type [Hymenolepis microstoma]